MKQSKQLAKTKLKKIRNSLEQKKNELLTPKNEGAQLVDDATGGDEIDIAQVMAINEMVEKLSLRDRAMVFRVSEVIRKIDEGRYGLCEDCGEVIPEKRLLALPLCTTCVDCAERAERNAKQYRRS